MIRFAGEFFRWKVTNNRSLVIIHWTVSWVFKILKTFGEWIIIIITIIIILTDVNSARMESTIELRRTIYQFGRENLPKNRYSLNYSEILFTWFMI